MPADTLAVQRCCVCGERCPVGECYPGARFYGPVFVARLGRFGADREYFV